MVELTRLPYDDVVDDCFLADAAGDRRRQILLPRDANEQVLPRLADVIRMIEPALDPIEARPAAGSVAAIGPRG